MLSDLLKPFLRFYFLLEEHYYKGLEAIEEKFSVPVFDSFVDPLESRGIPSFFVVILLFLLLAGSALVVLTQSQPAGLQVLVYGKTSSISGQPLDGALVELSDETGVLDSQKTRRGLVSFENLKSKAYTVRVTKEGFESGQRAANPVESNVVRLELSCQNAQTCAELEALARSGGGGGSVATSTPRPPGSGGGLTPGLTFSNPENGVDPESPVGRLLILVRDEDGNLLEGNAKVYDSKSGALIEDVPVSQGSGVLPSLRVGRKVFVNVFSTGFSPFLGKSKPIVIAPATNKVTVVLEAGGPTLSSGVRVVDPENAPVSGAQVSVYLADHSEVLYSDYSDAEGFVELELGEGSYFAVARAEGYLMNYSPRFEGGDTATIVLPLRGGGPGGGGCDGPCENEAHLNVHAVDDLGVDASYADVVLQQKTDFGSWFVVEPAEYAGASGRVLFTGLVPQSQVQVIATLYDLNGSAQATLVQGLNELEVVLSKPPFQVRAYAVDALANAYVSDARFDALVNGELVGQCQGNGCLLTVISAENVYVNASADGFVSSGNAFYLYEGLDSNVTLYLVNQSALEDVHVQWQGLYGSNGREVSELRPGRMYEARLQVFSKNADATGVVLDTQNDDAPVSGLTPNGFEQKGSYAGSCFAQDADFEYPRQAWVDVRYAGTVNGQVQFNFTLDPDITLDAATKTKVLELAYRAYVVRGSDYLRNPFDASLSTRPHEDHPSGCSGQTAVYVQNVTVKSDSTTCNALGCVTLNFRQGQRFAPTLFEADNQVLFNSTKLDPLYVFYTVEFFSGPTTSTRLVADWPDNRLVFINATHPVVGDSVLGNSKRCEFSDAKKQRSISLWASSLELDLRDLALCSNYAPPTRSRPLRFDGVAYARALEAGSSDVALTLSNGTDSVSQPASFSVSGFGVAANEFGIVEARLSQVQNALPDAAVFPVLSTGECTAAQVAGGTCDVGFVQADYRFTALSNSGFQSDVRASDGLQVHQNAAPQAASAGAPGTAVEGHALLLVPANEGLQWLNITKSLGNQATVLSRVITLDGGVSFNGSSPFPPGWDTCNGFVGIQYDPSKNPKLSLGQGCSDLGFRVTPVFPADAVFLNMSIPDFGRVVARAAATDGSHACYEVCEIDRNGFVYGCEGFGKSLFNNVQYLVRYNPELLDVCPSAYKVKGNRIAASQITVEFAYTGDQEASRNVTLHVLADNSDKSLYISPVYTFYGSSSEVLYPQLWSVTNYKQLGKRSIVFTQPGNIAVSFDGPGVKVFAVSQAGTVQAFEGSDRSAPIFDSANPQSPVKTVSKYGEALASSQQQFDVSTPYAEALSSALTESLSQNAFLQSEVAEKLSASVPRVAERTAYWRSSQVIRYCQQSQACVDSYYTLDGCCKESVEDWKNYTVRIDYRQESCTFCNNTFNPSCTDTSLEHLRGYLQCSYEATPSSSFQCDQRCTAKSLFPLDVQQGIDNQLGVGGTGITYDVLQGKYLSYGDSLGGRTCRVEFSSLNAFVKQGTTFTYYLPSQPKTEVLKEELERCLANGDCPLTLKPSANPSPLPFLGAQPAQLVQCVSDANQDGLHQFSESVVDASWQVQYRQFGGQIDKEFYKCPAGRIAAVAEVSFFFEARQNGVIASRTVATAADIERCRQGTCPFVVTPPNTPVVGGGVPICFADSNGNGFVETNRQSELSSLQPAVASGFQGGVYQCPSGTRLAVANFCVSSCENYCSAPNCDASLACLSSGVKNVPTGGTERLFNGWLNESPVVPVNLDASHLSRGKPNVPAAWFPDAFLESDGKPLFTHSYVVNSKTQPNSVASLTKVLSVQGCGPAGDYPYDQTLLPEQGLYEIRDYNVLDVSGSTWVAQANAVTLLRQNYLGDKSAVCRKPQWDTQLCEVSFVDSSSQYGGCFNSILQYQGSSKKLGADVPLVGGLGYGVKNGVGFGVAPNGHAFALFEPGYGEDKCEDKNKVHYDYQTLNHWNPDGKNTGDRKFTWRQDLGCHSDCGCKKGGYGLLAIILGILVAALFIFALPALTGGYTALIIGGASIEFSTIGLLAGAAIAGVGSGVGEVAGAVASSVIQTVSQGAIGVDCQSWGFSGAVAYACKGTIWQISAGFVALLSWIPRKKRKAN
ncbi:carboxypeptidase regulatory-like domain-containing protein [Candidatus Micrarchaeota archaeon]|nr:carboxypeptidase regulatory-like domain-containing protein [Candidatus Micrarchaeota archaeon]